MSEPKKPPDTQSKAVPLHQSGSHPIARPLHQSGSHPIARPSPGTLTNVSKPIKVGTGQSWANLMKSDVDEYARAHAVAAAAPPSGPGLIEKLKRLFGKRAKSA